MEVGDGIGLVVEALCVAVVNNKQFEMTAMDIAGHTCLC